MRPSLLIRLGALFLLSSALVRWFVHPSPDLSENALDGLLGLLSGLSIGFFLMAIWVKTRRRPV
jgi:hypothetical protein